MCSVDITNNTSSIRHNMVNTMASKQENRLMPVSPATLGVLPHDVGMRFKESLKKATINNNIIDECNKLIIELVKQKKERENE